MPAAEISPVLQELLGKVLNDVGAAMNAALVIVGDRLGLFRTLAERGPLTPAELAQHTGTHERTVREWLSAQAASSYITYDAAAKRFSMSPEQALVFANSESPVYMAGGFYSAASVAIDEHKITNAFGTGAGIPWGDHHPCLFCGTEKFFRPGYAHHLVQEWLPALDGVVDKLKRGARVADLGCGHGASTLIMARAFPNATFVGFDIHAPSIQHAAQHAAEEGLTNAHFEVATAQYFPLHNGKPYDVVTIFDALHDMGDPLAAARQVHSQLKPDGLWMIVEPNASDRLEENLHPLGRAFYAASTSICVQNALSQPGGYALGAQAGPAAIEAVLKDAGFAKTRIATSTPFNLIFEAKP